ncbi:hypothetical protein C7S16_1255 [Burkholderia thailandensis]|uniref:Uncharacterized protein n=1 Tax=Burkholderia thailandensis TaxID=57975 RepID=A0AAW9D3G9_BURTH|nr:hypothetical protein [Burkholderia thailandensis]MDW9256503.1 hypothetical protein [Burkholderia thailandensis]
MSYFDLLRRYEKSDRFSESSRGQRVFTLLILTAQVLIFAVHIENIWHLKNTESHYLMN